MRGHDWYSTPLGPPQDWPSTLKTTLRLLLTSHHPMVIWWGPDLLQFYNDAYSRALGPERHPGSLGQPCRQCWTEVWDIIGPEIDAVMNGSGSIWHEDRLVPFTRHGALAEIWWTYGFSPIEDEDGVQGVLVVCSDVTQAHEAREGLRQEVSLRRQAQEALSRERDRIDAALEKSQGDLARQVDDWRSLHAMSSKLLESRSTSEQFAIVLETILRLHGSTQGVISLFDPAHDGLVTRASVGIDEAGLAQLSCVPAGAGACGLAFQERQRVVIHDTETDPRYAEYRFYARGQEVRALYSTPFFNAGGEPLGVLSVYFRAPSTPSERELRLTDICAGQIALFVERDEAAKKLLYEQQRSHRILETMQEGFILMDAAFRVLYMNAAGLRLDGRPAAQVIGRTHWELWPDAYELPIGRLLRKVMEDRIPQALLHCYSYFGRDTWLDVSAYPQEEGIAVIYRDVTEHRHVQAELAAVTAESERRRRLYETVLSNSPDLAYVFDLDHRFIYANEVLLRMWDKTWDEAIGKTCLELGYEPWHATMHDREIDQVVATGKPVRGDVPFAGTFGRRVYDYIFVPVFGPGGEVEAVAGTTRDVTEDRQVEDALRDANRRKDEFLAMLAHELRNPLAPISAAAALMAMKPLDDDLKRIGQIIGRQVNHLTELVDDLLDVSRVTRGLVQLDRTPQDMKSIVSDAVEQVRPLIESRKHTLSLALGAEPATVLGDHKRLVQIVSNLLNNAAKYTPAGGSLRLELNTDPAHVTVSVIDDGIGIAADMQPRIFDLFTQAERTADRSQGGLGIGLSLVKSLVELHAGSVSCASAGAGLGTRFTVVLPRQTDGDGDGEALRRQGAQPSANAGLRIMVVDDNPDAAEMLALYLREVGHEVCIEHESMAAIDCATRLLPDVCILDIGLPGMDGNQLAGRLRDITGMKHALMIALTGYGQEQDRRTTLAAGFDHHLVKPADGRQLNEILGACDTRRGASARRPR